MGENRKEGDQTQSFVMLTNGTLVGHYRIIEKIGAGGMGEVYLAEDTKLKRPVALKFLPHHLASNADAKTRFTREAQAAAKLDHPNVVPVYEVGEYQGRPYFAMAHIEGQSLKDYASVNALSVEHVLKLGIQLGEGLQAAHEKGITHRDIKPSNILIDSHDRARIVDFGLASVIGADQLTKTGSTMGTVAYMSPEQARGKEVDARSDLFSFGIILYELIAGRTPFSRDSEAATLQAIIQDTPEPLARYKSDVPEGIQRIIDKLLDKDVETRYQAAAGVVADLKRERKALDSEPASVARQTPAASSRTRLWRILVPTSVVALVILLALVLKPWKFEIEPTQEAAADENRLAIMYFDNLADPTDSLRLGEIVTNLLITDLTESEYVKVISSQRLYDILKQLGREGEKRIDRGVATQIAEKAKAKWMLVGSILNTEPEIIIAAQLIEVASGHAIASQRLEGQPGERIFSLVDQLTVEIKNDLSLPAAATAEPDPEIADVTTHSTEAYRYYLEGLELFHRHYWSEARDVLLKAVEIDSTLAMAHYCLARMDYWKNNPRAKIHIGNAMKYADRVSQKERYYINSLDARIKQDIPRAIRELRNIIEHYPDEKGAHVSLGLILRYETSELEEAVACFEKAVELDPFHREALNQLAYSYNDLGRFEEAIWAINKYIDIAPDEANPYDSRGEILALNGRLDEAIASYEKSMELKPGFGRSNLADLYMFRGDYARADSLYQAMAADADKRMRAYGRLALTKVPRYQGRFREALRLLEIGIATDRIELGMGPELAEKLWTRAHLNEFLADTQQVISDLEQAITALQKKEARNLFVGIYRAYLAASLAERGDYERAGRLKNEIAAAIVESGYPDSIDYWHCLTFTASKLSHYDTAAVYWEKIIRLMPFHFPALFYLGESYFRSGQLGNAVATLEKAMNTYDEMRGDWPDVSVLCGFLLGQAYEASGWTDKAVAQYETFLDQWKDADPGIPEIEDAQERLTRLKSAP